MSRRMSRREVCSELCRELQYTRPGKRLLKKLCYTRLKSGGEYATIITVDGTICTIHPKRKGGRWDSDYEMIQAIMRTFFVYAENFMKIEQMIYKGIKEEAE